MYRLNHWLISILACYPFSGLVGYMIGQIICRLAKPLFDNDVYASQIGFIFNFFDESIVAPVA